VTFAAAIAAAAMTGLSTAEAAYPDQAIHLIVPYAPGGGTDITARIIAAHLEPILKQPVVVENKPGGGAQIGTRYVAEAKPDGYTLLMGSNGMCIDISLFNNLPYDATKDFIPITMAGSSPNLLLVNPSLGVNPVAELVALAKSKPGEINFGSAGIGQTPHLAGEMLKMMAGIDITHVPFKGSAESTVNLLSGTVQMSFATMPSTLEYIKSGQLKALAIASDKRSPELPDVPTMEELGYPGFLAATWTGIFAPAGTPSDIIDKLNTSIVQVLQSQEVLDLLHKHGLEVHPMKPDEFAKYFADEVTRWGDVIKKADVHLEQ
jgi:tripartite-type tricarboxylate transporter receptor subunit TctC